MSGLPFLWANCFYQNFEKIAKKVGGHLFERTLVRLFGDSNKCPFEQMS